MLFFPLRRKPTLARRRRAEDRTLGLESLERRLALTSLNIVDNTHLNATTEGSIYVTGHGIPGDTAPGASAAEIRVLGQAGGTFTQGAVTITAATVTTTTARITTAVPHQLHTSDKVFVSGVGSPAPSPQAQYNGVFTVTSVDGATSPMWFEYTVASGTPTIGNTQGAAYLPTLHSTPTITAVSANNGIVTVTLSEAANIPLNSPIFIQGLTTPSIDLAAPAPAALTNVSLIANPTNSNIAQATTTLPHGLVPGQLITVTGVSAPFNVTNVKVISTGLTDTTLSDREFTYAMTSGTSATASGATVTAINSAVIAFSTSNLIVNIGSGMAPTSGTVTLAGATPAVFNRSYTVLPIPTRAGLPATAALLVVPAGTPFTPGQTGANGTLSFGNINLNGVQKVSQNSSTDPALQPTQFQYSVSGASGNASISGASLTVASINPVALTSLPGYTAQSKTGTVILDENVEGFSSRLVTMLTPSGKQPFPLGVVLGTANISDLGTPPFAVGTQAGTSAVDILEFYYAGQLSTDHSTYDLSGVDGFALPLTLAATPVTGGPSQVGVNPLLPGISRQSIGTAFTQFIQKETVPGTATFSRLLYTESTSVQPLTVGPSSQPGTPLTGVSLKVIARNSVIAQATTTAAHGLVPGQLITVTGAVAPFNVVGAKVISTGLTDPTLLVNEFTYQMASTSTATPTGATVTPTNSGVIAYGAANLAVRLPTGTQALPPGSTVQLVNVPNGSFTPGDNLNANYTVLAATGLPSNVVALASLTGQAFQVGASTGGGTLQTPVFLAPPPLPDDQFYVIAAPKDWLVEQPPAAAILDPMVSWWDSTIDAFFKSGNYLQVAVGHPLSTRSYTGVGHADRINFWLGTSVSGSPLFSIHKPTPATASSVLPNDPKFQSLANALWVWGQQLPSTLSGDSGLVFDEIVQAFCRGVALDGVLLTPPSNTLVALSNQAWTTTTNWYTPHTTPAGTTSVYCPYSKFLHFGTLDGGTDFTGENSIYLGGLAYGFSEDEIPIGSNGIALSNPRGGPAKMDGTVPGTATLTLTVNPWKTPTPSAPTVVSVDTNPPQVGTTPTPTDASSVTWTVTFSEPVKGVTTSNFALVPSTLVGTSITSVTANGVGAYSKTWTVTANTGTGTGTLGLNLTSPNNIVDRSDHPLSLSGSFVGQVYNVNRGQTTATITLADPNPTSAATVQFTVTFSPAVTGLTGSNFTTIAGGGVTGATVLSISGSGTTYTVTVNTGTGSGTLALQMNSTAGVTPAVSGLPVTSAAYAIDKQVPTNPPTVQSINRVGASPTSATSVSWTVTFSEPVTGLTVSNFALVVGAGLGGTPTITGVTPTSTTNTATWTVTASTGTGSGTLGLDMTNSAGVRDAELQPVTDLPFIGAVYSIDRVAPALLSIARAGASPTAQPSVSWTVTFTKPVGNVSKQNFLLVSNGLSGAQITQVVQNAGTGTSWTVTALTGSGNGTLGLNMVNATGITDSLGLPPTGIPLAGQTYQVQRGGATIVAAPIAFMTTAGVASKLVWMMPAFTDADSVQMMATLAVSPASGGTLRAISRGGVTVTPSGTPSAELQFSGTQAALNVYFANRTGFITYTPTVGQPLTPRSLTLSAQGSDGLAGMTTAALLVRASSRQDPAPTVTANALLAGTRRQPLVITYAQLVAATGATQTTNRSIQFMLGGINAGRLEVWTGSRWAVVPRLANIALLAPGGQIRWTPPANATGLLAAFTVRTWDGWRLSGLSQVRINLTR